jgi:hypothetical protein
MSAKAVILLAPLLLAGCAKLGLERFAPPGTVKYEDLSRGEPIDPEIKKRIAERKAERAPKYPELSEQPSATPEGMEEVDREESIEELEKIRDAIDADVEAARNAAAAEREPTPQ